MSVFKFDRREALLAAVMLLPAPMAVAEIPPPALLDRVSAAAVASRQVIRNDSGRFSGPGWERLLREGLAAQFFVIGEEHGIAENPRVAAALFQAFAAAGYSHLGVEISAPIARVVDGAARQGMAGLRAVASDPSSRAPFADLEQEAELLVAARRTSRSSEPVIWGLDYELEADRRLIAMLRARAPRSAQAALAAVEADSRQSWEKYAATHNPQFIYSFGGDPGLVRALIAAWPTPDPDSAWILRTLDVTLAVNELEMKGAGFASNQLRSTFIRENFLKHWARETAGGRPGPRAMIKMGASHVVRGLSMVETFDLGSLLPELAALEGRTSFNLLVLPGTGSKTAVFDPSRLRYGAGPPKDGYARDLEPITGSVAEGGYSLFDLRPLRPLLDWRVNRMVGPELMRVVHGFDSLLVMTGSTPSVDI